MPAKANDPCSPGFPMLAPRSTFLSNQVAEVIGISLKPTADYLGQPVRTMRICTQPRSTDQPLPIPGEKQRQLELHKRLRAQVQQILTCARREAKLSRMMARM